MNKITVVIPTICKTILDVFQYTINQMNNCDCIDKIIIIDNTERNQFVKDYTINNKIQIINDKNYFVNMAWNKGVEETKTKYYLLLNDDILCDKLIFNECFDVMENNENIGIATVETVLNWDKEQYNTLIQKYSNNKKIKYFENQERVGWFVLGRKNEWKPIEDLKIYYGDDFLYRYNKQILKKQQCMIENLFISHFESTTSKNFMQFGPKEELEYKELIKRYGIYDNRF